MEPKKNPAKDVHRYSKHFFLIGFIISCSLAIMAFEWKTEVAKKTTDPSPNPNIPPMELYPVVVTSQHEDLVALPKKKVQVLIDPSQLVPDKSIGEPVDNAPDFIVEPPDYGETVLFMPEAEKEISPDTFIVVENMPVPVGGYENFYKQITRSMKYPRLAKNNGTEGKVFVEFVINENGDPVKLKVTKGIGSGCDDEARRVIGQIKWVPGKQRGRPVLVKMTVPIYFKLQ